MSPTYLEHHGILGQKWGIRRFQNPDGTLTEAGKKRQAQYDKLSKDVQKLNDKTWNNMRKLGDKNMVIAYGKEAEDYAKSRGNTIYDTSKDRAFNKAEKLIEKKNRMKIEDKFNDTLNELNKSHHNKWSVKEKNARYNAMTAGSSVAGPIGAAFNFANMTHNMKTLRVAEARNKLMSSEVGKAMVDAFINRYGYNPLDKIKSKNIKIKSKD